jgi:hypothetical protein
MIIGRCMYGMALATKVIYLLLMGASVDQLLPSATQLKCLKAPSVREWLRLATSKASLSAQLRALPSAQPLWPPERQTDPWRSSVPESALEYGSSLG